MPGGDDSTAQDFPVSQRSSSLWSLQVGQLPVFIRYFFCHGLDLGFLHFVFRLGLPSSMCPKCRSEITGRAHDTEQFLISAPKADPAQNPAKPKTSNEAKDCESSELLPPQGQNESNADIQLQPLLEVAEKVQDGVQARQQQQQSKIGTPKTSKRVTWSPSVQK